MKKTIKIILIAMTSVAIVTLLFFFTKRIENAEIEKIEPQNFMEYMERRVDEEVDGKTYEAAKPVFYELIDEINTEDFVRLNDTTRALSADDVAKCKSQAFYAYVPLFIAHGNAYFEKQTWTTREADAIRDEAKKLLSYNIAESGTQVKKDLDKLVKNVKEYHEALTVVSNASKCATVEDANKVINSAKNYKHAPLTNNKKLQQDLNGVPDVAKETVATKLLNQTASLVKKKRRFGSYTKWFEEYSKLKEDIEGFETAFGRQEKLIDAKKRLDQADEEMLDYYD